MTEKLATRFFNPRNHRGLIVALAVVLGMTLYNRINRPVVQPPPGFAGDLAGSISLKLDPNTATEPELQSLPNIGPGRARNIIDWRESHQGDDGPLFKSIADLKRVKGLPASVVDEIEPYLKFPSGQPQLRAPSTQP